MVGFPSPNQKFTKNDIKDHIKITNHQKKWDFFMTKIICLEQPKMQNKHNCFFPFWESQRTGKGGVKPVGPYSQLLPKISFASFPQHDSLSDSNCSLCIFSDCRCFHVSCFMHWGLFNLFLPHISTQLFLPTTSNLCIRHLYSGIPFRQIRRWQTKDIKPI